MFKFGISDPKQFLLLGKEGRSLGARAAYNLLAVGEQPTPEQIRLFEDVSFRLQTSNGTFRTSFRNRFDNITDITLKWIGEFHPAGSRISIQDRAVSHGLTSKEFAEQIFKAYPAATFEASDLLLGLVELSLPNGDIYITEQDGKPLQFISAPFVVPLYHPEARRYPVNRWIAKRARRRFEALTLPANWTTNENSVKFPVRQISCIHPEAIALSKHNPNFQFRQRSVFDRTPGACHVLRTMNIFNRAYFSEDQLADGAKAVFESLHPGGLWIVGRTLESDFSNHVTFLRRGAEGWEFLERFGQGSELEELVLRTSARGAAAP